MRRARSLDSGAGAPGGRRVPRLRLAAYTQRARILGDPDRLRQIFANLANNACQAAPWGSEVAWRIASGPGDTPVRLSIHNAGEAIPAHILPRLTQPFFSTRPVGTDLGLAIVQRLVERQGGELRISSSPESGTLVELTFPSLPD